MKAASEPVSSSGSVLFLQEVKVEVVGVYVSSRTRESVNAPPQSHEFKMIPECGLNLIYVEEEQWCQ